MAISLLKQQALTTIWECKEIKPVRSVLLIVVFSSVWLAASSTVFTIIILAVWPQNSYFPKYNEELRRLLRLTSRSS